MNVSLRINAAEALLQSIGYHIQLYARATRGLANHLAERANARHGAVAKASAAHRRLRRNAHRLATWTGAR